MKTHIIFLKIKVYPNIFAMSAHHILER